MARKKKRNKNASYTPPAPSSEPGTHDVKGVKPARTKRKPHPLVGNKDPEIYPFSELPGDFGFATHKPLKKSDFVDDAVFFEYKAAEFDAKAVAMRVKADEAKKMGSVKDRIKARRLVKMQEKMAELRTQLEDQGIDVDALLETDKPTED